MYTDILRKYMPSFLEISKTALSLLGPAKTQLESSLVNFENISKVVNSSVISPKNYYSNSSKIINESISTANSTVLYSNLSASSENSNFSQVSTNNLSTQSLIEKSEKELKVLKESGNKSLQNRGVYIDMTGMNNYINAENDMDDFIVKLTNKLESSLNAYGEGVHI